MDSAAMNVVGTVMYLPGAVQWQQISDGCHEWAAFLRLYRDVCTAMRDISTLPPPNARLFTQVMQQADDLARGMTGMAEKYAEKASGQAPPNAPTTSPEQDWRMHSLIGIPMGANCHGSRVRTGLQPLLTEHLTIMQRAFALATAPESAMAGPRPSSIDRGFKLNTAVLKLQTAVSRTYQLLALI